MPLTQPRPPGRPGLGGRFVQLRFERWRFVLGIGHLDQAPHRTKASAKVGLAQRQAFMEPATDEHHVPLKKGSAAVDVFMEFAVGEDQFVAVAQLTEVELIVDLEVADTQPVV
jgi:hypothetical protein